MKNLLFTIMALFVCGLMARAQTQQGSFLAGGGVSFYFATEKDEQGTFSAETSITDISFNPRFGFFFADEMVAGADLSIFSFVRDRKDTDFKSTSSGFGIGPFFRYYTTNGFFGHAAFQIGSSKNKIESGGTSDEQDLSIFGWEVGPGYVLFLNENVAIEGLIVYGSRQEKLKDSDPEAKETFSGVLLEVGFTVFIN